MKILVISQSGLPSPIGGAEITIHQECAHLAQHNDIVLFTSRTSKKIKPLLNYKIVNYWPGTFWLFRFPWLAHHYLTTQIKLLQKKGNFDIWHIHFSKPFAPSLVKLANTKGIPSCITCHGGDIFVNGKSDGNRQSTPEIYSTTIPVLNQAKHVIAVSHYMKTQLSNIIKNKDKISCLPHGIDPKRKETVDHKAIKRKFLDNHQINDNKKLLLFCGRNSPEKGAVQFLKSLTYLPNEYHGIMVGQNIKKLSNEVSQLEITHKVSLLDAILPDFERVPFKIPPNQLEDLYHIADLVIIPSFSEAFGLVALEGFAFGCCVLSSDAGALKDLVIDSGAGVKIDPNDPKKMSEIITNTLADKTEIKVKIQRGYDIADKHSLKKRLSDLERLLKLKTINQ